MNTKMMNTKMMNTKFWLSAATVLLVASGCGGGSKASPTTAAGGDSPTTTEVGGGGSSGGNGGAPAGDAGTVVLGDETIAFDSARCDMQEQAAPEGGGKILFSIQAYGSNANGDEIRVEVSRYDQDSQFVGDKIELVIGDPFSADAVKWNADDVIETVALDGQTAIANNLTFTNGADGTTVAGSFEVHC